MSKHTSTLDARRLVPQQIHWQVTGEFKQYAPGPSNLFLLLLDPINAYSFFRHYSLETLFGAPYFLPVQYFFYLSHFLIKALE